MPPLDHVMVGADVPEIMNFKDFIQQVTDNSSTSHKEKQLLINKMEGLDVLIKKAMENGDTIDLLKDLGILNGQIRILIREGEPKLANNVLLAMDLFRGRCTRSEVSVFTGSIKGKMSEVIDLMEYYI